MKYLARLSDIPADRGLSVAFGDRRIALFRIGDSVHAIDDSCPHQGASLANGRLDGVFVKCPAHGLQFDVRSGCMKGNPGFGAQSLSVQVQADQVLIDDPAAP
jgi:3-phenylpropionate/trans-cinnamate dioxygenase ferredoxin subunit